MTSTRTYWLITAGGTRSLLDQESLQEHRFTDVGFGGLEVRLRWHVSRYRQKAPHSLRGLMAAWPGRESLLIEESLAGGELSTLFCGLVTGSHFSGTALELTALQADEVDQGEEVEESGGAGAPDALEIAVAVDGRAVEVVADNKGRGEVLLAFGDVEDSQGKPYDVVDPGDGESLTRHVYAEAGTYAVTVWDAADPSRAARQRVTVV